MEISEIIFNKTKRQDKLIFNKNYKLFYKGDFLGVFKCKKYKNEFYFGWCLSFNNEIYAKRSIRCDEWHDVNKESFNPEKINL